MTKNIKGIEYEDIILITKAFKAIKGFKTGFFKSLQKEQIKFSRFYCIISTMEF